MSWRALGNYLSLSGAEVVSKLLTLIAFAYVARTVGPVAFGYVEVATAVALCAVLLVDQGFGSYGAREIARDPARTSQLVAEITTLRLVLAVVVYAGLVATVLVLDGPPTLERLILLYGLVVLLVPGMLQWVYQGHDRMGTVAGLQVLRQGLFAAILLGLLRSADRLWLVAVAEVAGAAAVVLASVWLYRRDYGRLRLGRELSPGLLKEGSTIGLGQVLWSLRIYGATILVGTLASGDEIGYFGAAMRIAVGLNAFVWLYFFNLLPSLARTWSDPGGAFQRLLARSLRMTGWLTVAAGTVWILAAPDMTRWVYGASFAPAGVPLQWLSGICILGAIHGHFRFGLIAAGKQHLATLATGVGTAVALAAIPYGYHWQGLTGAAMGLVIGEGAVLLLAAAFAIPGLQLSGTLGGLVRPTIGGAAVISPVYGLLSPALGWPVQAAIAVAGLTVAAVVTENELRSQVRQWWRT